MDQSNAFPILLVEDDIDVCNNFQNCFYKNKNMSLIGITNNSKKAIELIKLNLPYAVILDLELHTGGGNGLEVLQGVKELDLSFKPFFLVTTNNTSSIIFEQARNLGADFIMHKHEQGYSEEVAIAFLLNIYDTIYKNFKKKAPDLNDLKSPAELTKIIEKRAYSYLDLIGVSPKMKGYNYLADGIVMVYNGERYCICNKVAEKHNKTESSVERAMQNAIQKAWRTSDINDLEKYYTAKIQGSKGVPTITEFVFYYANVIKAEV